MKRKNKGKEKPAPIRVAVDMSVGQFFWLLIAVGGSNPLWVVSSGITEIGVCGPESKAVRSFPP